MDDDDIQDTGVIGGDDSNNKTTPAAAPAAAAATPDEPAPAKPPRPLTEAQKNEAILKEAFPTVDSGVIKAVLTASGGRIDPAFNALLRKHGTWGITFQKAAGRIADFGGPRNDRPRRREERAR